MHEQVSNFAGRKRYKKICNEKKLEKMNDKIQGFKV